MAKTAKSYLIILALIMGSLPTIAQPTGPELKCVSVSGNNVTLSWIVDNTDFEEYFIERSTDGLNYYFLISFLNTSGFTYTYNEPAVNSGIIFFRMYTEDDIQGKSQYSNEISTINLNVTSYLNNSFALLNWNDPSADFNELFFIQRRDMLGPWVTVGSTLDLSWSDTITYPYCLDTTLLFYRISAWVSDFDCQSLSTVDSGYFADGYYPGWLMNDIMEMDSVSVDDQGNVLISWFPYPANDIEWYYLYRSDQFQGGFYKIDSVPSDIHFYLDTQSSANLESVSYRVAAKDTCHAPGPGGFTNPFSTIFLRPLLWDYCDTAIELNWDSVKWMNPPPDLYQIYKVDPENHSLNTFIGETTQTNYTYETGFKPDSTYCFFVRAKDPAGKSSSSCIQCFTANRPEQPDTLNFRLASVDTAFNDRIEISVFTDTVPSATTCLILRYSGNYNDIDTLALIPVLSNDWISWSDTTADPNTSSYVYETVILDGCNNPAWLPENRVKTIFLQGTAAQNINYLSWNNYSGSTSEAAYYMLYRKINGLIDAVFTTATDTSYMDNLNDVNQKSGRFSYLVEAKTVNSLIPTAELDTLSSFSNEIQIVQISRINMPNAFTPNSDDINDFFGPMNVFTDEDAEFSFLIFNRWGQKIFESSDIRTRGWDGTVGGSPAPTGVYLYLVRYVTPEGSLYEAKGPFTLLR